MNQTRNALVDRVLHEDRSYWLRQLAGDVAGTTLPPDFPPGRSTPARASLPVVLDAATAARVWAICDGRPGLVLAVLLAALEICLHKYTGAEDLLVGTPPHEARADAGPGSRALPLRSRIEATHTLRDVLTSVKQTLADAFAHQKYPVDRLAASLDAEPARDPASLMPVILLLEGLQSARRLDGLATHLLVSCRGEGERLDGTITYDASRHREATVAGFAARFARVATALVFDPDRTVRDLSLLSPDERHAVVHLFNESAAPYPRDRAIHRLIEAQAGATPSALAARCGDQSWSYADVNGRANQVARRLRDRGIGPGQLVGIRMQHSAAEVIGVLGVLKAGAAYVPFDPAHPVERVATVVDEAGIAAIIGDAGDTATAALQRPVIELGDDWSGFDMESRHDLADGAGPDDLAYVIYTSGSTGRPKGVAITHRALVNYVWWARDAYLAGAAHDFALFTSLAFDLTVTSIFTPLVTGNALIIYPARDAEAPVLDVFRDGLAGVVKLTPSHLALVAGQPLGQTAVRTLIVGGEALDTDLARRIHDQFGGDVAIYNEYGPTEATVGCMIHRFDVVGDQGRSVPIGRPAANTQIHVLAAGGAPAGDGMIGELFIAGDGLARGYVNRDDLTAAAFLDNPFQPGTRMYRTGDRVRRQAGGVLEFLGRGDDQIKLHGYRIDLDEYRHALNAHPQISDSVARLLEDDDGRRVLVAYYVSRQELDVTELRTFLGRRLIEGTLPQMFAHLRRLPLTLNGKVNYRALPGLTDLRERLTPRSIEARTDTERLLAQVWCEILRLDRVGVEDSFFELGGHSLLATQVVSRVRDLTGVELPLRGIFEAPTIAALAARVDAGRTAPATAAPAAPTLTRRAPDAPAPLSFAQQRLWFLNELDPGSAAYNITTRLDVRGALRPDVLQRSLDEILRRHESLRTTFVAEDGRPVQVIHAALPTTLAMVDLEPMDADARSRVVADEAAATFTTPFDLQQGPLVRGRILRVGPDDHILLFAMHHIVGDGWSMGVLLRELATLYEAFDAGRPSPLPDLALHYADYATWQRDYVSGPLYETQLAYWRAQLAGITPLDLPADRPRAALQTFRGGSVPVELPPDVSAAIDALSRREGVTPFMTVLAAFDALLHRYTGQDDVVVGSPIANRHRTEIEPLIGFFANTLVLRTSLAGDPTFRDLLARVRDTALGAYAHQDLPFERLVEALQPDRDLSHNPLFQVMFALQNAPMDLPRLGTLEVGRLPAETGTAKFDLNLALEDSPAGLVGTLDYNSDIFDESTAARMAAHLGRLLRSACDRPDTRVSDLELLSEDERRQVLVDWNATRIAYPEHVCVHTLVEAVAARTPEAPAVAFGDEVLTYRQLNARANQLAHRLRRSGVGPDVLVGVCLERSLDMAVAVLAVLKAGGAYVPLDPDYPAERLAFMAADTGAPVLLAQASTRDRLPSAGATVIDLPSERPSLDREPDGDLDIDVHPENLLYVIYTSGSTGRPKGTALSHRALGNLIRWNLDSLASGTAMLQFASLSFDASFHEMFAAWGSGRLLVMIPEHWRRDPEELFPMLAAHRVETVILPVVVLHQWAEHYAGDPRRFAMLREVVTTGEQLVITQPIVDLFSRLHDCRLHNHYGPSETHVVTAYTLSGPPSTWPSRPSIGRPIANSTVYVLDRRMNPVPVGVYGELYLGGTNLARGYLGRPDLTAARFIPHPYSDNPGARLYAVGDVGRFLPDGTLEYLGRRDDQAKIRGFRVEPGEVEGALNRHPHVSQSVVVVDGAAATEKRLVAYVVPAAGREVSPADLREFLLARLPDYLVPAVFMVLPGLALTPNGKIDRRALPAPAESGTVARQASRAPESAAERLIAGMWSEVLGHDRVGVDDSFFHVGGHSLLATQVVSRIRRAFGLDLPLRSMFETPTIAGLVEHLGCLAGGRETVEAIADALITVSRLTAREVGEQLEALRVGGDAGA